MVLADISAVFGSQITQLVVGLVVVVALFVLLKAATRLIRFGIVLAVGAAAGAAAWYGLTKAGVPERYARWAFIGVALVALFFGMRRRGK